MKKMQGFTLIELMIVVAIIAILAAIAIPQYQDYVTKSQFAEGPTIADGLKTPITEYFNQVSNCPTNATTGFKPAGSYIGKYVVSATLAGAAGGPCIVTIQYGVAGQVSSPLVGKTMSSTGTDRGGTMEWVCHTGVPARYVPKACQ